MISAAAALPGLLSSMTSPRRSGDAFSPAYVEEEKGSWATARYTSLIHPLRAFENGGEILMPRLSYLPESVVLHGGHAAPREVDLLQVWQLQREEDVRPECGGESVVPQVDDLRARVHAGDGAERGVHALHRLLAALPLARARLGAVGHDEGDGVQRQQGQREHAVREHLEHPRPY